MGHASQIRYLNYLRLLLQDSVINKLTRQMLWVAKRTVREPIATIDRGDRKKLPKKEEQ